MRVVRFEGSPSLQYNTEKDLIYDTLECLRFPFLRPNVTKTRRPSETLEILYFLSYSLKRNCKF